MKPAPHFKGVLRLFENCATFCQSIPIFLFCFLFQTQFTQGRSYNLFQENRKNQKGICKESCHQNQIGFGPVNFDKIREASIQGRAVFYLPKTLRVNREMFLHTTSELLPDAAGVISLFIVIGACLYKTIFAKNTNKTGSNPPIPVKSASSSSTSSLILGTNNTL